jgi:transposase
MTTKLGGHYILSKKSAPNERRRGKEEQAEFVKKREEIIKGLQAHSWKDLEVGRKFRRNEKLDLITADSVIVGCDIGSVKHFIRAIDAQGRALTSKPFSFDNDEEGFKAAYDWMVGIAAQNDKTQIVLAMEPTGHYWFCFAAWCTSHGITVVQVNPYAVKATKEIQDNSQLKSDRKDPGVIAELAKNGNYSVPYIAEGTYASLRELELFRERVMEDRVRDNNRLCQEMDKYFPEYRRIYKDVDMVFSLAVLAKAPLPEDIVRIGEDGIRALWHSEKLRGRGYSKAAELLEKAQQSVGLRVGQVQARMSIQYLVRSIRDKDTCLAEIDDEITKLAKSIQYVDKLQAIPGLGERIISGILSEIGDLTRFDDVKGIQKYSGLGLVSESSGKHNGETHISHRGRKRLRYWLYIGAKSVVAHSREFAELHAYYTTRDENPLKKMQSLMVIACKLLRIIYVVLTKGVDYDPHKMLGDIVRPENTKNKAKGAAVA